MCRFIACGRKKKDTAQQTRPTKPKWGKVHAGEFIALSRAKKVMKPENLRMSKTPDRRAAAGRTSAILAAKRNSAGGSAPAAAAASSGLTAIPSLAILCVNMAALLVARMFTKEGEEGRRRSHSSRELQCDPEAKALTSRKVGAFQREKGRKRAQR
mmetsp:Transcript_7929/g.15433  ORF Transcript_7929/g.15433 Transcript_7929/m.15433 type:complete len:156 (-) Transcript_7929:95-562(-)